jgi:transposase
VRFETAPGKQIDFRERLVEIAGANVKTGLFVQC